jgi:hypothetical protein
VSPTQLSDIQKTGEAAQILEIIVIPGAAGIEQLLLMATLDQHPRATDTPMPLSALCEKEMIEALARGWADRDASIFLTLQEERAQIQVRLPPTEG